MQVHTVKCFVCFEIIAVERFIDNPLPIHFRNDLISEIY